MARAGAQRSLAVAMPATRIVRAVLFPLAHLFHGAVGTLAAMAFLRLLRLLLNVAVVRRLPVFGLELLLLLGHRKTFLLAGMIREVQLVRCRTASALGMGQSARDCQARENSTVAHQCVSVHG
jgi:hypothetical protein